MAPTTEQLASELQEPMESASYSFYDCTLALPEVREPVESASYSFYDCTLAES